MKSRIDPVAEEQALALAHAGRVEESVKILMRAYGAAITGFALRILGDGEAAHDVRQQVFLDTFLGLSTFKGQSSLWSWLCGIAYHRCMDERRRTHRHSAVEDDVLEHLVGPLDPETGADRAAELRALERCLAKLSTELRSQLLMRYYLGLSHQEIGELVRASHSTVQVRISRILPRLRRCLQGSGVKR